MPLLPPFMRDCAASYDGEDEEKRGEKFGCFRGLAEAFAEKRGVQMVVS